MNRFFSTWAAIGATLTSACEHPRAIVTILVPQSNPAYRVALAEAWRTESAASAAPPRTKQAS